jgi:CHAD domain-containing protein
MVPTGANAAKSARAVVRAHLDAAVSAASRLGEPAEVEALHDCRVALRRLRVALKAYAPVLKPGVPKDLRKAVSVLADRTGPARDAEVFHDWLEGRAPRLRGDAHQAATWLLRRVARQRDAEYRRLRRLLPKGIGMLEPLLRAGLAVPAARQPGGSSFEAFTAGCVEEHLGLLRESLDKVRTVADHERAHRARIAAKKVRYLLEPVLTRRGKGVIGPLKAIQDGLGRLHDLGGAATTIAAARRSGEARPRAPGGAALASGLDRLGALARREQISVFKKVWRDFVVPPRSWLAPAQRWVRRQRPAAPPRDRARGRRL